MILTCPECATSYFVNDDSIPLAGRTVRCTNCGARWRAEREATPPPEPEFVPLEEESAADIEAAPHLDELVAEPREAADTDAEADAEPARESSDDPAAPASEDDEPPPVARVRRIPTSAPPRKPDPAPAAAWIVTGAVLVALAGGAVMLRQQVVGAWPQSSVVYGLVGLDVSRGGLVIEEVRAQPSFQAERPVLSVTGVVRNPDDHPLMSPPLRLSLLDKDGKTLAVNVSDPLNAGIPARAKRHFAIVLNDPPAGVRELEVTFEPAPQPVAGAKGHD